MEKVSYKFEDFLAEVSSDYKDFVTKIHDDLTQEGYKPKIESKKSGMSVSYSHPKTKRGMLSFLFRKDALLVRLYADNFGKYADFLHQLPEGMEKEIGKAAKCSRLIDPNACNPKCVGGYDFYIRENHYQKCRMSCFQLGISSDHIPVLADFIENERKERMSA